MALPRSDRTMHSLHKLIRLLLSATFSTSVMQAEDVEVLYDDAPESPDLPPRPIRPPARRIGLVLAIHPGVGTDLRVIDNTGIGFHRRHLRQPAPWPAGAIGTSGDHLQLRRQLLRGNRQRPGPPVGEPEPRRMGRQSERANSVTADPAKPVPASGWTPAVSSPARSSPKWRSVPRMPWPCAPMARSRRGDTTITGNSAMAGLTMPTLPVLVNRTGVLAGKTVIKMACGEYHSLALCSDGTLAAWGTNQSAQLGDGTTISRTSPVAVDRSGVLAGKTVVAIAAAQYHNLVLCSDGSMATWGGNTNGKLGNGGTAASYGSGLRRSIRRACRQNRHQHRRRLATQPGALLRRHPGLLGSKLIRAAGQLQASQAAMCRFW